ncbi:Histone-lysine N-methyltransferase SUVR3 [Vitis vinifera]|uniref:Histone-lysine N-methyltransferase SUVR3 n=1 Tax=Vitis vinifera TaxID=29760 RepID=A0A438DI69_VITVI|nr:Histone-lysine N-methyltransferase SUVR3 [Vitis vinifera]
MYDELSSSGGRFSSALLVVREHLPSGKACLRMNIDGTRIGNVARFINHSCDGGNLLTVLLRSSGALLPRLCFFASKIYKKMKSSLSAMGILGSGKRACLASVAALVVLEFCLRKILDCSEVEPLSHAMCSVLLWRIKQIM